MKLCIFILLIVGENSLALSRPGLINGRFVYNKDFSVILEFLREKYVNSHARSLYIYDPKTRIWGKMIMELSNLPFYHSFVGLNVLYLRPLYNFRHIFLRAKAPSSLHPKSIGQRPTLILV